MSDNTSHSLKELVIKLNDRNIQRQRESGLTVYVILALVFFILFYLIENAPEFFKNDFFWDNLVVTAIVGDMAFVCAYCLVSVTINHEIRVTKVFTNSRFLNVDEPTSPLIALLGVLGILNFHAFFYSTVFTAKFIYLIFGILMLLNFVAPFAIIFYKWWKARKETIEIPEFTYLRNSYRKKAKAYSLLYFLLLLILVLIVVFNESLLIKDNELVAPIKYSIFAVGFFISINKLLDMNKSLSDRDNLEELEKEIYLNNLSNADIKIRLEQEYFGQDFKSWCQVRKQALAEYFEQLKHNLLEIGSKTLFISNAANELEQRKKFYIEAHGNREDLIRSYDNNFRAQIKHLIKYSSISSIEMTYLIDMQNYYAKNLEEITVIDTPIYNYFIDVQKGAGEVEES